METPKKSSKSYCQQSDAMSTPSSSLSAKKGVIVTPGSSNSRGESSGANARNRVKEPHDNDVLCGRGGSINSHPGNERFRQLVEKRKRVYLTARFKREKRLIANSILSEIRTLQPSGRFLARDTKTGTWYDIGDEKARDKTSQALRENAPSIRAEIEVEINQQRAEMQRAEDEAAMTVTPSGPPHPYYQQPWGYYAPYHGYGQYHPEQPRYAHDDRYERERQWHGQYAEGDHASVQCHSPASASVSSSRREEGHYNEHHDHPGRPTHATHAPPPPIHAQSPPPPPPGDHTSGFDVPNFVSSVPSSIAAWTRTSFSFGGHSHASEHDRHEHPKKPLPHPHRPPSHDQGDHRQGRRVVHFEDDSRSPRNHPYHYDQRRYNEGQSQPPGQPPSQAGPDYYDYPSPSNSHSHGHRYRQHGPGHGHGHEEVDPTYSQSRPPAPATPARATAVTPESAARKSANKRQHQALEPHNAAAPFNPNAEQQSSLLSQVANHILGSWDTSMVCANSSTEEPMMMTHEMHPNAKPLSTPSSEMMPPPSLADAMEDEEGQEVELMDMMEYEDDDDDHHHPDELVDVHDIDDDDDDIRDDEHRMPPPESNNMPPPPRRIEIDWPSKMVGCQSNWLPETFNTPAFFNQKVNPLSPSASLEMDVSAVGTEGISCTDSIGGASLCQVFSHDQLEDEAELADPLSPMDQPELSHMPSWERSVRSKSPSTICSDPSIVSKDDGQNSSVPAPPKSKGADGDGTRE